MCTAYWFTVFRYTPLTVFMLCLVTQACPPLYDPMDCSPLGSSVHGGSPGRNTGVGCHAFLQGIVPTQWLNPGLPHCRWIHCRMNVCVCVCVSHIFFICSPADGHLACLHISAVASSAAVNIRVHGDLIIIIIFWPHFMGFGIFVPQPGIKPVPPAMEAWES